MALVDKITNMFAGVAWGTMTMCSVVVVNMWLPQLTCFQWTRSPVEGSQQVFPSQPICSSSPVVLGHVAGINLKKGNYFIQLTPVWKGSLCSGSIFVFCFCIFFFFFSSFALQPNFIANGVCTMAFKGIHFLFCPYLKTEYWIKVCLLASMAL